MENENTTGEPLAEYTQPLDFGQVWLMFQETDKMFQETDKKFQETDKKIDALRELFTSQWGKLIESLVEGDLVSLLQKRNIPVDSILQRRRGIRDGENYEFDLIAVNETVVVIVEVKTTLRPKYIDKFLEKLRKAKIYMPEYKNMTVYGAVAFISAEGSSDQMAENRGLFVIRATGNSAFINNATDFVPRAF